METQSMKKVFICKTFLGTLKGGPYHWFIDLPSSSIINIADLMLKFVTQHISNIRSKKSSNILMDIKQGSDSLCCYT